MVVKFDEDKQKERLGELHEQEEEGLAQMMAQKYGLPYIDLATNPINIDALRIVKEQEARDAELASFNIINKKVSLAVMSPNNDKTVALVESLKDRGYIPTFLWLPDKVWKKSGVDTKTFHILWKQKAGRWTSLVKRSEIWSSKSRLPMI